jgi:hypothetical protein
MPKSTSESRIRVVEEEMKDTLEGILGGIVLLGLCWAALVIL